MVTRIHSYLSWSGSPTLVAIMLIASIGNGLAAESPHVVVFLSDDHTITDSSLYGDGATPTPNMDRVASSGMTFHRAFVVSPSCAPSRAALLTGLMPPRNGAEANHSKPLPELKKLPAYLKDLGYEVVSFGKVGHYVQTPTYGFDIAKHFTYHDDVAVAEAIKWLNERDNAKPLCLFVGTNWPHVPWPAESSFDSASFVMPPKHVDTPQTRKSLASYREAVKTMDRELGEVYDAAYKKLGDNTFFLCTSDHGAQWPFAKWNLYDTGIRTPLIVTWPGKIVPQSQTKAMVTWVDILPTVVEVAQGDQPSGIDGRSFVPVLLGQTDSHRDVVFTTHSGDGNMNVYPSRAVRDQDWKYIRNLHPEFKFTTHVTQKPGDNRYWATWIEKAKTDEEAAVIVRAYQQRPGEELYDLRSDPDELVNLASDPEHADKLQELRGMLDRWMSEMKDSQKVFGKPTPLP